MSSIYIPLSIFTSLSYWFGILHILLFLNQFLTWIFDKVLNIVSCVLSFVWHFCNSVDRSLPGSTVLEFLQARILGWISISSSRGSSWPRDQTHISCIFYIAGRFFTTGPPGKLMLNIPWLKKMYVFRLLHIEGSTLLMLSSNQTLHCIFWDRYLLH